MWTDELTTEQEDLLIERAAEAIEKRKMTTAAILALEMHRPVANVGANAAVVMAPFIVPLFGFNNVNDYSRLMRRPENIDRLIRRLEATGDGRSVPVAKENGR